MKKILVLFALMLTVSCGSVVPSKTSPPYQTIDGITVEHPSPAQVAVDQARRINLQVTPSPFKETAGLIMGGIAATLATIAANHSRKTKKLLYAKNSNLPI